MNDRDQLVGKAALVTGGTAGIGYFTARALAGMGAAVFITGRDVQRGHEAERQIRAAAGHSRVHFIEADASCVGANQKLAQQLLREVADLDILVNNVGGGFGERRETADGYESTLAMNLVGPFALTEALLPALRKRGAARIVNVTSAAFSMWRGDPFADPQSRTAYSAFDAYCRSKYLNLLWTLALARRLEGSGVVANALHPGVAWTSMTRRTDRRGLPSAMQWLWPVLRVIQYFGSAEKAARTSVFLASAAEAAGFTGQYFDNSTRPKQLPAQVLDPENQEKAWKLADSLVRL